ncbi:hypothetical protein BH09PAT2_BH09PAT2_00090 [soil metagenome]
MTNAIGPLKSLLTFLKKKAIVRPGRLYGLGVYAHNKNVYLYFRSSQNSTDTFNVAKSSNGLDFNVFRQNLTITNYKQNEDLEACSDFQFSKDKTIIQLFYKKKVGRKNIIRSIKTTDPLQLEYSLKATNLATTAIKIPNYKRNGEYYAFVGETQISLATSKDLQTWKILVDNILPSREGSFDSGDMEVEHVMNTDKGILLIYHTKKKIHEKISYTVGAALFDKEQPEQILWRSNSPVWEQTDEWKDKQIYPIGIVEKDGSLISYWGIEGESIYAVAYSYYKLFDGLKIKNVSLDLQKAPQNPVLSPNKDNHWEAFNTFNPAALYEDGKVHILYRAQGYNYVSVLGYATSTDGVNFDVRHDEPAYIPKEDFEYRGSIKPTNVSHYYVSGGGYGGCEDPRTTRIGDRIYLTYVAFDGYSPPRVALSSIAVEDFLKQRWLWEKPVIISPPGVVDKSAVIFPEKINGKYVIMHRIYPDILIDYVDTLAFDGTWWLKGEHKISPRPTMWDSRKIGAGAPPLKTKDGWLLIYQSVGNQDSGKYKIGAMLLDINDPSKVLYRCNAPILEPVEPYENDGFKAGVVYPCGAVIKDETLFVYYGGADSYVCVATANLDEFLNELKYANIAKLDPVIINKVM